MAENNNELIAQVSRRKQIREPPAIPFLWESRPGVPIKNWKPPEIKAAVHCGSHPPVSLAASVPFVWEEKPGKPMPLFLLTDHDEFSEPDSIWDCESMSSYRTGGTDSETSERGSVVAAGRNEAPTLGELIMMSRRMSIRRRRAQTRNLSMDVMKKRGLGCFNISRRVGLIDWIK